MLDGAQLAALGAEGVAALAAAGVDWFQLRERELPAARLAALLDELLRAARAGARAAGRSATVLVNRRIDLALACGADGVHLGFDALPPAAARRLLGPGAMVGVSCHAPDEVAAAEGASYAHLAPIFTPLSKPAQRTPLGLAPLAAAAASGRDVLAQGGVCAANAAGCVAAGASGVAVTGTLLGARDPRAEAAALRAALDAARA